ncbi:MAG: hypothetical protein WD069_04835 [Planctomycetales bacterium]
MNEIAQWVVLSFIAVFLVGLTRQLGLFIVPRREQLEAMGPVVNRSIPKDLLSATEQKRFARVLAESPTTWGLVVVIDSNCHGCHNMLAQLKKRSTPSHAPIVALVQSGADDTFIDEVREVVDVAISDPGGERRTAVGIAATPYVMIVGESGKVLHRSVTSDLRFAVARWRTETRDHPRPAETTDGWKDQAFTKEPKPNHVRAESGSQSGNGSRT